MSALVCRLVEAADKITAASVKSVDDATPVRVDPPRANGSGTLDKSFAIELCNQVHRLSRSVIKAAEQGSSEAGKLKGHVDRLGKLLDERSLEWEDLTGQA